MLYWMPCPNSKQDPCRILNYSCSSSYHPVPVSGIAWLPTRSQEATAWYSPLQPYSIYTVLCYMQYSNIWLNMDMDMEVSSPHRPTWIDSDLPIDPTDRDTIPYRGGGPRVTCIASRIYTIRYTPPHIHTARSSPQIAPPGDHHTRRSASLQHVCCGTRTARTMPRAFYALSTSHQVVCCVQWVKLYTSRAHQGSAERSKDAGPRPQREVLAAPASASACARAA